MEFVYLYVKDQVEVIRCYIKKPADCFFEIILKTQRKIFLKNWLDSMRL